MTPDEFRALHEKDPREADAWIAEKVMGWRRVNAGGGGWFLTDSPHVYLDVPDSLPRAVDWYRYTPDYTASLDAAREVEERALETLAPNYVERFLNYLTFDGTRPHAWRATALDRCIAAALALGVMEE